MDVGGGKALRSRAGSIPRPMHANRRRWVTAAVVVLGADAALLLAADLIQAASQQLHASAFDLVAAVFTGAATVIPSSFTNGLGAILGSLGADWWQRQLLGPALAGEAGGGPQALGGVLAAPVYAIVRRMARRTGVRVASRAGSPPHRIFIAARSSASESSDAAA